MADQPSTAHDPKVSRAEKLSILSSLLGPDAVAKLQAERSEGTAPAQPGASQVDAQRVEWHRNKLLERFRTQGKGKAEQRSAAQAPNASVSIDQRLAQFSDPSDLSQEHPAVITRILSQMPRDVRINALKKLPGPVARSVVRRLR